MAVNPTILKGKADGYLSKDVAGDSDVALSPVEARCRVLSFSGELTGDIVVSVPLGADEAGCDYWVENATTGSFSLTLKGGALGSGLAVTQAKKVGVVWTGGDFVAFTAEL